MIKKWLLLLPLMAMVMFFSISPKIEASTTQYNIIWEVGLRDILGDPNNITSNSVHYTTNKIPIINNSINIEQNYFSAILFFNNNNFLGWYSTNSTNYGGTQIKNNFNPPYPSNATHFALLTRSSSGTSGWDSNIRYTITQSQQTIISYQNIPTPDSVNTPEVFNIDTHVAAFDTYQLYVVSQANAPFVASYGYEIFTDAGQTLFRDKDMTGLGIADEGNLTPNTTYWYKGYVEMTDGNRYYGPLRTFTTPQITNPSVPEPTVEFSFALDFTYTLPAVNPGNQTSIAERGLLVTTDGTTPTITNFQEQYTVPNSEQRQLFPNGNYGTTYKVVQYMRGTNNAYYYSTVLEFTTPGEIFNVVFTDWDGTEYTVQAEQGTAAQVPTIPDRPGYTLTGWEPPITNIQGNLVTYAQYELKTYVVTFYSDIYTVIQETIENHFTELGTIDPYPTRQGFTLSGWYESTDSTQTPVDYNNYQITKPVELVAIWTEIPTYTITWRNVNFDVLKIETVNQGSSGVAPTNLPIDSGFRFVGWSPDPNQPVTADINYILQVEQIPADELITQSGTTIIYRTQLPDDYNGLTDLFGGVFGGIIGLVMTLGTIDLFGIELSAIIFLFVSASLGLTIFKMIRG